MFSLLIPIFIFKLAFLLPFSLLKFSTLLDGSENEEPQLIVQMLSLLTASVCLCLCVCVYILQHILLRLINVEYWQMILPLSDFFTLWSSWRCLSHAWWNEAEPWFVLFHCLVLFQSCNLSFGSWKRKIPTSCLYFLYKGKTAIIIHHHRPVVCHHMAHMNLNSDLLQRENGEHLV